MKLSSRGSWLNIKNSLKRMRKKDIRAIMERYGQIGIDLLKNSTPVDSGLTASSWNYKITEDADGMRLTFNNTNIVNGLSVAILIDSGHATKSGTWVSGLNFIEPNVVLIFKNLANDIWAEVNR